MRAWGGCESAAWERCESAAWERCEVRALGMFERARGMGALRSGGRCDRLRRVWFLRFGAVGVATSGGLVRPLVSYGEADLRVGEGFVVVAR